MKRQSDPLPIILIIALVLVLTSSGVVNTGVTQATYVYEKDAGGVPRGVQFGLNQLNDRDPPILATAIDDDAVTGVDAFPEQYRIAVEAARKEGLPALVVQSGDRVVRVVKAPTTEAEVKNAAGE